MVDLPALGRPLVEDEGRGIEIRIGDMFRFLWKARASFEDGYGGVETKENRLLAVVRNLYWNFIGTAIFSEVERIPNKYKPEGISLTMAHAWGRESKGKPKEKALAMMDRRIATVFQRGIEIVVPHELKHIQLNDQTEDEMENSSIEGKAGVRLLTGVVGGFLVSAIISQSILQFAKDQHINIPSSWETVWTWGTIALGTIYGMIKGLGWERDIFAHEDEAYLAGKKLAKEFKGAIMLERISDKEV